MRLHSNTTILMLVAVAAIVGMGSLLWGSPTTGLTPHTYRYASDSAGIGQDVSSRAAEICYPNRRKFERYSTCCSQPCSSECANAGASDIKMCQSVCQDWCIKAVTQVYLERPIGFVGAFSKGMKKPDYIVYN